MPCASCPSSPRCGGGTRLSWVPTSTIPSRWRTRSEARCRAHGVYVLCRHRGQQDARQDGDRVRQGARWRAAEDAPGVYRLTKANWLEVMGDRPTDALWGVGAKTSAKLSRAWRRHGGRARRADVEMLQERFGPRIGVWIASLGRGPGERTVTSAPWVPKGRSREVTLEHDVVERPDIEVLLRRIATDVVGDVASSGRGITHVAIKVRFVPFFTTTRVHKLSAPTRDAVVVGDNAVALLDRLELGRPIRLLGVRVELTDP